MELKYDISQGAHIYTDKNDICIYTNVLHNDNDNDIPDFKEWKVSLVDGVYNDQTIKETLQFH